MSPEALFAISFVGIVFWPANPEAATALFASQHHWHPVAIGSVAAAGQIAAVTALFLFGAQLRRRWGWFDRKCERLAARLGPRMERNALAVAVVSGLVGFPPVSVVAALAPALAPRPLRMLPVVVVMRIVRFSVVAALAIGSGLRWP